MITLELGRIYTDNVVNLFQIKDDVVKFFRWTRMKISFVRDRTSTTASTASNLTIITAGNQCFDIIMLYTYHQEILVSSLFAAYSLGWSTMKAFLKSYHSPELRITRQFEHNCVCERGAEC